MQILWPPKYDPSRTAVFVSNSLSMAADAATVWAWLVRAQLWPAWYKNSSNIHFPDRDGPDLKPGSRFSWKTFGVALQSKVEEFVPLERLAWSAKRPGIDAYHAWLIEPTPEGCMVLTEETQNGALARLSATFMPNRMHKYHQIWLDHLSRQAQTGLPA